MNNTSLLNTDQVSDSLQSAEPTQNSQNKLTLKFKGVLAIIVVASLSIFVTAFALNKNNASPIKGQPIKIRIALPPQSPFPIELGNSRVLQVLFYSGYDDRTLDDYTAVSHRDIIWESEPSGGVSIDEYGRLQTLSLGTATIRVKSKSIPNVFAERSIEVVAKAADSEQLQKRVINYGGTPAELNKVLQKVVTYKTKAEALESKDVPQSIKNIILDPKATPRKQVIQENGITWTIEKFADGSNRSFIKRANNNEENIRDRVMFFIGDRYLPGSGLEALSIEDNEALGLWTVNSKGEVSLIEMKAISYKEKAELMVENTQKNVLRYGLASYSQLKNEKWIGGFDDNDGLWTSMYAAGEFMRLGALRSLKYPDDQIKKAKDSALYSLKAILLLSNIASRNITIDARIRHFVNTRTGKGQILSSQFLKKDRPFAVDEYVGSPADGEGFFGIDAGKTIDGNYQGGEFKYSFLAVHNADWSSDSKVDTPATSKRTLNGFIARSFIIEPLEGLPQDGMHFRHNEDGKQYVLNEANRLYDFTADDHPTLDLGNMDLPQILKDFLIIGGVQYIKSNLIYKGDTSTDEIIGHLFIYKIAFDILDESNEEQNTLKQLIKSTMINFCTCLTNNGYTMVDATGQGTSWGKLTRTFMSSDFTIQDAPIKSLQLLLSFKVCYYVTGDDKWQKQYEFLIKDASFQYLDLVASAWRRWTYRAYNQDYDNQLSLYHMNSRIPYSQAEVTRHIISGIHKSDQQQAYLGYYLAFQLEDNQDYLAVYREGIQGWWHSISRSQNPLWYYIYQLAYPKQAKKDHYGNNILEVSSWQLSRHSIDTRKTSAFIQGSRDDVIMQGQDGISEDPKHILQRRRHLSDAKYNQRKVNYKISKDYNPINIYEIKVLPADERKMHRFNGATFEGIDEASPNQMLPSTTYTLPYWMGVYHNMLKIE